MFYKIIHKLSEEKIFVWNIKQKFKFDDRGRITSTLEFDAFNVKKDFLNYEMYLNICVFLISFGSLYFQLKQMQTSL